MRHTTSNPALFAGIGGASAALFPTQALALTLPGFVGDVLASPLVPFAVGILGGVAVAGGIYGAVIKICDLSEQPRSAKPKRSRSRSAKHAPAQVQVPVAASIYKPRHMSPQDFEKSGVIRVQPANAYTQMKEQEERRTRQKHLKPTIMERLGVDMMEGVPVIERADGSVGDVGTSWWVRGVGEKTIISDAGFANEESVDDYVNEQKFVSPQELARRVARIDEGLYPEKRTADDLDNSDVWTSALEALDEKLNVSAQPKVSFDVIGFSDNVGGSDSLDEPEGLAQNTDFLLFKVPAGHPEVTDTASYIEHVISDELSRSSSPSIRSRSQNSMRLFEGGTHGMKFKDKERTGRIKGAYVGKHFAPMAAQA